MLSDLLATLLYSLGGLLIGMTAVVSIRHLHQWGKDRTRLLPLHIGVVALSYDLFVISLLTREDVVEVRAWLYGPALLLGVVAMVVMLRHQGRH